MESDGLQNVDMVRIPAVPVFNWSVGNFMERFFDGLKGGKFMGVKCPDCGRVYLPPRMICERCFAKNDEWVELPPEGTVESFTLAQVKVGEDGELADLEAPVLIGMVKHEGADTCLVARIEGLDPEEASVGIRVTAVLDKSAESILDILSHYVPR
ncbi:MAG: Zn-ribbon domain-containing OB-fold protein [Actinomycetia bacterium]|nr:Zn-ribbon domain-containing OB-fold protein [Actinomycetota bacterium]MBU4401373.1 Zn-ribbon domain-containing OB-fold protein [Actinomycetota bacterium]MCG2795536.1 Zn-ribbon domain-containing OB-fold protein [Actinomycetes bacterium]